MPSQKLKQANTQNTQTRILKAAIVCVKRLGMDRVTLNEIAQEAGVTRPTIYSYFGGRDEVIQYALLHSGNVFVEDLINYVGKFKTPHERVVEGLIFCLKRLPQSPDLMALQGSDMVDMFKSEALTIIKAAEIRKLASEAVFHGMDLTTDELEELSEVAARWMLSLLMLESPKKRSEKELRAFLKRRLLPALGL